jgi:hypothetical protein
MRPQVFATGYSTNPNLVDAVREGTHAALASLLKPTGSTGSTGSGGGSHGEIDLAILSAPSLYEEPAKIIPTLLDAISNSNSGYGVVRNVVGSTAGGVIGSSTNTNNNNGNGGDEDTTKVDGGACTPFENEAAPTIQITLALLPDAFETTHQVVLILLHLHLSIILVRRHQILSHGAHHLIQQSTIFNMQPKILFNGRGC